MEPARDQAMWFAFDRYLNPITPTRGRGDGVRAAGGCARRRDMQREKLTSNIIEWDATGARGSELERLYIVRHGLSSDEREHAAPSNLPGDGIIFQVTRGPPPHPRLLRQYLHMRVPRASGRKAFAKG